MPRPPRLPFPEFKWKWASFAPTETLNDPAVFLGVLRALSRHEGASPSDVAVQRALLRVERDTGSRVKLARDPVRNLLRNSGQYWKTKGLLEPTTGRIELTQFGRSVAQGLITRAEFAAKVIAEFTLPNSDVFDEATILKWQRAGIRIRPLQLILAIIAALHANSGEPAAYLTTHELAKVVVPLSAETQNPAEHALAVLAYRVGRLKLSQWPDCTPEANDLRIIREFLLFLRWYGFVEETPAAAGNRFDAHFGVPGENIPEITRLSTLAPQPSTNTVPLDEVRSTDVIAAVERRRSLRWQFDRPNQIAFRRSVLAHASEICLLTGERMSEVLEAAHIRPVEHHGGDSVANGLCLRSDVHTLFDAGHVRIDPVGQLHLSDATRRSRSYSYLPHEVSLPTGTTASIRWRWEYL